MVKKGDRVHAGFGSKGGAGFKGTVSSVEKGFVTIESEVERTSFGSGKTYKPKYRVPSKFVSKY